MMSKIVDSIMARFRFQALARFGVSVREREGEKN
jgi:hypothetical protein